MNFSILNFISFWRWPLKERHHKLFGILLIFLFWEVLSLIYPSSIIPSPIESLKALIEISQKDYFWPDLWATLYRITLGTLISLFLGTVIGISTKLREVFYPWMVIMEDLTPLVWIILAILWFSIGDFPPIVAAIATAVPLVFFNVVEGTKAISRDLLEMLRSFSVSKRDILLYFHLPSIAPGILSGFSASLSMNWRVVVMAEAFSSYTGVGQRFWGFYVYGSTAEVFAYVLLIAALGVGMEYLLVRPLKNIVTKKLRLDKNDS